MKRHPALIFATALVLASITMVSSGTSSFAASGGGSGAVAHAQKFLTKYENPRPTITLPALSSKPPKGKTLDFVGCPISSCLEIQQAVQAAAKRVGWNVKVFNAGLTPAGFLSAMDDVVQSPGNAVLGIGGFLSNSAIQSQLSALKAKGVPLIQVLSTSPLGDDMIANYTSAPEVALSGKVMAAWIIVNSKAKANVAYFWDPSVSGHLPAKNAFVKEMSTCSACVVNVQPTNFTTGIGTTDPAQIVSYLQRNPSTNYIVIGLGDATAGVPQALAAAGLSGKVKIVTRLADTINFKDIAAGTETMGVTEETSEIGWRMVDVAARWFLHDSLGCCSAPIGTIHVITKADLPSNLNQPYTVPNYQATFLKAWHLSK